MDQETSVRSASLTILVLLLLLLSPVVVARGGLGGDQGPVRGGGELHLPGVCGQGPAGRSPLDRPQHGPPEQQPPDHPTGRGGQTGESTCLSEWRGIQREGLQIFHSFFLV